MATHVIMPALGMSQDTGTIVRWLKTEGEQIAQGETLAEVETDKATVDLEAPAAGTLANLAAAGEAIPTGQTIALILAHGEALPTGSPVSVANPGAPQSATPTPAAQKASPLASRIAAEHNLDLSTIHSSGRRIQKADVLTHLQSAPRVGGSFVNHRDGAAPEAGQPAGPQAIQESPYAMLPASPKARRLAAERGSDIATLRGSGPAGAVLAADVLAMPAIPPQPMQILSSPESLAVGTPSPAGIAVGTTISRPLAGAEVEAREERGSDVSHIWRVMAEHTTQSWTSVPHFSLMREVNASRLMAWRAHIQQRSSAEISYTDLLVKVVAMALHMHPRLNASWLNGRITTHDEVNIGLAVAVEDGLVVPVIHRADTLDLREIARRRIEVVALAHAHKLRPQDIQGGTFTISNLGMYGVDAFNAIINTPQAAILAVGRIAERVVPLHGQPAVQPMLVLNLSCDHRVVDGARGAQFLATLADLLEEPLGLLF